MTRLYILDGGSAQIGPFKTREEVERFVQMMALCGEDWADNTIVERSGDAAGQKPAQMDACVKQRSASQLKLVGRKP